MTKYKYPALRISLKKITENAEFIVKMCQQFGISVAGVTKVTCGSPEVAQAMIKGGVSYLADSRIENLRNLVDFPVPKLLLRLPMISQADDTVKYADASLNSEVETVTALNTAAESVGKAHKVIFMVDLGDLREGVYDIDKFITDIGKILTLPNIKLEGIGVNFACYGGVIPSVGNMEKFLDLKDRIESKYNISLTTVSGGNSINIHLLRSGTMPYGINHLRVGETILFGIIPGILQIIPEMHQDTFHLCVEIIEIQRKPSVPVGDLGVDAFNRTPEFEDNGVRTRAICAFGRQDVNAEDIVPLNEKVKILGQSGDHTIIDITDSVEGLRVGDILEFRLNYPSTLKACTSKYITKVFDEN